MAPRAKLPEIYIRPPSDPGLPHRLVTMQASVFITGDVANWLEVCGMVVVVDDCLQRGSGCIAWDRVKICDTDLVIDGILRLAVTKEVSALLQSVAPNRRSRPKP